MAGVAQRLEEKPVSAGLLREILLEGEIAPTVGIQSLVETQLPATLEST
jgi:hypothetical protein